MNRNNKKKKNRSKRSVVLNNTSFVKLREYILKMKLAHSHTPYPSSNYAAAVCINFFNKIFSSALKLL